MSETRMADLLSTSEAASMLGVSVSYIRNSDCPKILLPGNGPKAKPIIRIRRDALEAWLESHTARATEPQRRLKRIA